MITLKMYNGKWQIHIGKEIWQFENMTDFYKTLSQLIAIKEKYGRIKNELE